MEANDNEENGLFGDVTMPGPLPLETLKFFDTEYGWGFSCLHILELPCLTPNLIECTFHNAHYMSGDGDYQTLPKLRRLIFL